MTLPATSGGQNGVVAISGKLSFTRTFVNQSKTQLRRFDLVDESSRSRHAQQLLAQFGIARTRIQPDIKKRSGKLRVVDLMLQLLTDKKRAPCPGKYTPVIRVPA